MAQPYSRYYTYIKPLTQNKLVRSYAPYIFSLITVAILVIFAIRPTISTVLNLQTEIKNKRQTLQALNAKAQTLTQAKSNYDSLGQANLSKINSAVPLAASVVSLTRNLQTALVSQQSSTSAIQIQPVILTPTATLKAHPDLGQVIFTLNAEGSFQQFLLSLANLAKSPRVLQIDTITISKTDIRSSMIINGKGFYLK